MVSTDDVYRYTARVTPNKIWGTSKVFSWEEPDNTGFIVHAEHGEAACGDECIISGEVTPARNYDGERIKIHARYKSETIYIVPLYWKKEGENERIINMSELLPGPVRDDFGHIRLKSICETN